MANSNAVLGTNVLPGRNVLPLSDRDAAERFSAVIVGLPSGKLAQSAHRSKDAAKRWKQARQCPSGASLLNMARALPPVWEWICEEAGHGTREAQACSVDAVLRMMYQVASGVGPEARRARQMIAYINRGEAEAEAQAQAVEAESNVIPGLFEQRRRA